MTPDLAATTLVDHAVQVWEGPPWCPSCEVPWPCLPYQLALELTVTRNLLANATRPRTSIRDDTGVAT
jgi:hypothetical protein